VLRGFEERQLWRLELEIALEVQRRERHGARRARSCQWRLGFGRLKVAMGSESRDCAVTTRRNVRGVRVFASGWK
jgi:hypothetical protein